MPLKLLLIFSAAVCSYLISGLNPAIMMSKAIYHTDIRTCGSGNAGFTNFKRSFGSRYAWWVFILDLAKGAVLFAIFGLLFAHVFGDRQLGVALSLLFAMLGHAFPIWYGFRGGKGFTVCLMGSWFLDWRVGLLGTAVMVALLLTVRFMSLATMSGMVCSAALFWFLPHVTNVAPVIFCLCVLFMIIRHAENIGRLVHGTESRFVLKDKK